ncbi:hypothetical protein F0562_006023 [Nyssa sinensis]|uniref:Uncharacterized protein n=1 Tax=Nyssa sinensis TaxID=561372 RepID=A0A5J5AM18_9ASTE|nr:hypothetical protein F0562_006023 [Nyssa sinensis]
MASIQLLNAVINGLQVANDATHSLHAKASSPSDENKTSLVLLNAIPEFVDAPQGVNARAIMDRIGFDKVVNRAQVAGNDGQWQQGVQAASTEKKGRQWQQEMNLGSTEHQRTLADILAGGHKADAQTSDEAPPHTLYASYIGASGSEPLVNDNSHSGL